MLPMGKYLEENILACIYLKITTKSRLCQCSKQELCLSGLVIVQDCEFKRVESSSEIFNGEDDAVEHRANHKALVACVALEEF